MQNSKNTSKQSVSKIVQSVSIEVKTILHFEYSWSLKEDKYNNTQSQQIDEIDT